MPRPRKEKTEVIRIREQDAQRLRQLQLKVGLPSVADAMALLIQQYNATKKDSTDWLITSKYTLESVVAEMDILTQCDKRYEGWKGYEIQEIEPGAFHVVSPLGGSVTIKDGDEVMNKLLAV